MCPSSQRNQSKSSVEYIIYSVKPTPLGSLMKGKSENRVHGKSMQNIEIQLFGPDKRLKKTHFAERDGPQVALIHDERAVNSVFIAKNSTVTMMKALRIHAVQPSCIYDVENQLNWIYEKTYRIIRYDLNDSSYL
ncbi:hypothetical protein WA026_010328 [Henosepilachna vigintioctopunctata]|uniref:Uncharacterized protein n=1 Tax=Henosepilachna vigintioctopunctata TaxID=420089 RepID=A0AAW1VE09_9CUCU